LFAELTTTVAGYAGIEYGKLGNDGAITSPQFKPTLLAIAAAEIAAESNKIALLTGNALHHCGTMSLFGEGPLAVSPEVYVEISRADAEAKKIEDGDLVTVSSAKGSLKLKAQVTPRMAAGTAFAPYHFSDNSINNLTSGTSVTWVTISK
jgi:predicted molibdopterin-dependent oxidoreductase YjgC